VFSGLGCFAWISVPTRMPRGGPLPAFSQWREGEEVLGTRLFCVWCGCVCSLIGYAFSNDNNNARAGGGLEELGVAALLILFYSLFCHWGLD